jgi:hypothetical protein
MQVPNTALHKIFAKFLENNLCANFYRPNNLSTLITFDAGGVWSPIAGPTTDHDGHPILGCSQVSTLPAVFQCSGSGSGIRCLFDPWIRDPE